MAAIAKLNEEMSKQDVLAVGGLMNTARGAKTNLATARYWGGRCAR